MNTSRQITFKVLQPSTMNATVEANEPLPIQLLKWYTLGQAAKAVGRSKAALSRAVKNGTISAEKQPDGSFKIAASELFRVYRPVAEAEQVRRVNDPIELNAVNRELRAKLEATTQRLAEMKDELTDMREQRDKWCGLAERLALTDQRAKAPDVMVTPPPTAQRTPTTAIITSPPPAADQTPAPATPTRPNAAPVAVKMRPVKKSPAKELGWFRRMMGGR